MLAKHTLPTDEELGKLCSREKKGLTIPCSRYKAGILKREAGPFALWAGCRRVSLR